MIKNGLYRHYKGMYYEVIGMAKHAQTNADLIIYRPIYGARGLLVAPIEMFEEMLPSGMLCFTYCGEVQ